MYICAVNGSPYLGCSNVMTEHDIREIVEYLWPSIRMNKSANDHTDTKIAVRVSKHCQMREDGPGCAKVVKSL